MSSNMMNQTANQRKEFDFLCQVLPENLVKAAEVCSLPHTVNNELGYKILHDFAGLNGTAKAIWAEVKNLPFVYPYEEEGWRFDDTARIYFKDRLEKRNGTFTELNQYLKSYYENELQREQIKTVPHARELEWRVTYHLAPVEPEAAIERLKKFGERAAQGNRISDMKGVIDLLEEQKHWLSTYRIERAYFEGRYEYSKKNYISAEKKFRLVWEQGKADEIKAIAGHLLGHILQGRNTAACLTAAEKLFRESLKILKDIGDQRGVAMVLNSLGGILQRKGSFDKAIDVFQKSYAILEELGDQHGQAMVLNSQGGVLQRKGKFDEAIDEFNKSYAILVELKDQRGQAIVLNSLGGVLQRKRKFDEAIKAFTESYVLRIALGDQLGLAMVLNSLGGVLHRKGDFNGAIDAFKKSAVIGEAIGDKRHLAMVFNSMGGVLQSKGNFNEAIYAFKKSYALLIEIGDQRGQGMVYTAMGKAYLKNKNINEAITYLLKGFNIDESIKNKRGIEIVTPSLIDALVKANQRDQAISYLKRALAVAPKSDKLIEIKKRFKL